MEKFRLSVTMTNYNNAQYIERALESIVKQSFLPFELIVCDDGSTDNSLEIIQRYLKTYDFIRLIKNGQNLGLFPSLDKLIASVSGDYLYAAASDDMVLPGFFEKSMELLKQNPQAGLCSTMSFIINKNGERNGFILTPVISGKPCFLPPKRVKGIFLRNGSWISGISSIINFHYFRENGGYRKELQAFTDGFLGQVLALKYGACFIPEPLTCWRRLGNNYSITISKNPDIFTSIIEKALVLMQTEFLGLFPRKYIEAWKRQNYFYLHYNNYFKISQERLKVVTALGQTAGMEGRFWICCFKFFFFLEKNLAICFLYFVFKRNPWRTFFNQATYFFIKFRYGLLKKHI